MKLPGPLLTENEKIYGSIFFITVPPLFKVKLSFTEIMVQHSFNFFSNKKESVTVYSTIPGKW